MYADAPAADHWSNGYLIIAYNLSLMDGYRDAWGNRVFDRQGLVAFDQTVTIVLRALSYGPIIEEQPGYVWPQSYRNKAVELGLIDVVTGTVGDTPATRGEIAPIVHAGMVEVPHADTGEYLAPGR